jgi:hypothetical protein
LYGCRYKKHRKEDVFNREKGHIILFKSSIILYICYVYNISIINLI